MSESLRICLTVILCVALICVTIVTCFESYTKRVVAAMEHGYVESTVPGSKQLCWTKVQP